jgi:hypothetical protein
MAESRVTLKAVSLGKISEVPIQCQYASSILAYEVDQFVVDQSPPNSAIVLWNALSTFWSVKYGQYKKFEVWEMHSQ